MIIAIEVLQRNCNVVHYFAMRPQA